MQRKSLVSTRPIRTIQYRLFYSMRPTLLSILFPSTTLFRSRFAALLHALESGLEGLDELRVGDLGLRRGVRRGDRKSTRLNSSHQIISYAVFCLKKKQTPTTNNA